MEFDFEIREPYLGNTVPLKVKVTWTRTGMTVEVVNPDGIHYTSSKVFTE